MNSFQRKCIYINGSILRKCFNQFFLPNRRLSDNRIRLSYYKITPLNSESKSENSSPVLIFHGLFGSKNNWKSVSKAIASKTGRSVYAFDLRNHGLSGHTSGPDSTHEGMANDIKLFLDENQYEKAALIGHRVEKLIPVDITPLSSMPKAFFTNPDFTDQLSDSLKNVSNDLSLSEARKQVNENLKPIINDQFIRGFFLMSLDKEESGQLIWRYNLEGIKHMISSKNINQIKITAPFCGDTLLIHGMKSQYVNPNDYNAIREVLPNVKFVAIPEAGHYLHIEKPNEFIASVVSFLNSKSN